MARSRNGQAIVAERRTAAEVERLRELLREAEASSDLPMWRRAKAVLGYLEGRAASTMASELDVSRQAVTSWLSWYNSEGADGLRTRKAPGAPCRLSPEQRATLTSVVEAGPLAAGFQSGVWTGPMVGAWVRDHLGVTYHPQHIPRLLHELGFSVQRPRKRLARADWKAQAAWLQERWPAIKKKARRCRGVVLFEDEASFWLDGTLHQTWSRVGVQPRVDTFGQRKTAHVFGALALHDASFTYRFADVFNGHSFHLFLMDLVAVYSPQKVFLVIDNGPCHWLDEAGRAWLAKNKHRLELHRLPPYSPEFNPTEGVWKATRKLATHNRFYRTEEERDQALRETFQSFQRAPSNLRPLVARLQC